MSLPNIVLFAPGRSWEFEQDAYVSSDGWAITSLDLIKEPPEERNRIIGMFSDYFQTRLEREAARLCPKPEIESTRVHAFNGKWYAVRDVWSDGGHIYRKGLKLDRCEYAVKQSDGSIKWTPCEEGCEYSSIEPFVEEDDYLNNLITNIPPIETPGG